ncbi:protealysin inhibitor emfourin [Catenulispora rubra]|uniref:protealysin inhibitor emfourin n=1 Tax=Catenulispora rubra TaxID=280293 RepID=UPI0018927B9F|nr:protealysin inhibitor emfourin [Catenulispora rubra]
MARMKPRPTDLLPVTFGVGLILLASMTAGCASQRGGATGRSPGDGPTSDTGSLPQIAVQRTGGFAGLKDTVTVDPHGTWNATDRAGTHTSGSLAADQLTEIRTLATDPRLATEAGQTRPPTRCRDAFAYRLTVGGRQIEFVDCPADPDQPVASIELVKKVVGYTISNSARRS